MLLLYLQTLGSDLNGIDRQRDFISRYSCAGGRASPPSVDLDHGPFTRPGVGGVPASGTSGVQGGLIAFPSTGADVDLPGTEHDAKPSGDGGRRSNTGGSGLPIGRSPGSNKSGGISSSASSTGNSSAMYETGTGNDPKHRKLLDYVTGETGSAIGRIPASGVFSSGNSSAMYETGNGSDVKHQQLDYVGGGGGGGLLSSDPLHYYPHLGGVASSAGFSPYQPRHHHHPGAHHPHHLSPAAYQPYGVSDLDYTSTSAFFHSNVFKAAAAASQIRTKSHSSSG